MTPYEVIKKKRDGGKLSREEIEFIIGGCVDGSIPDYQTAAFLMAAFLKGLDHEETAVLTQAMTASGAMMDLSSVPGPTMDKHSTGGVGDKVSLPLAPLVAACGGYVPMMSGRGLGHTGGTLDKLESIPGFRVDLPAERFAEVVSDVGCAIIGQTADIAPADKKLYALRDVTATVDSMHLIAASILSKKLAAGPESLVLDVKTGSGAFMREISDARALADIMVGILENSSRKGEAVITNMDQPLGIAAGNAVEVAESIEVLKGEGPGDLTAIVIDLGARMLAVSGIEPDRAAGRRKIEAAIGDGRGLERFSRMIEAQGGDPRVIDDPLLLPRANERTELVAERGGVIESIETFEAGMAIVALGAGRASKEDEVDPAVGVLFHAKPGDEIEKGESILTILWNDEARMNEAMRRLRGAITVGDGPARTLPLILEEIGRT